MTFTEISVTTRSGRIAILLLGLLAAAATAPASFAAGTRGGPAHRSHRARGSASGPPARHSSSPPARHSSSTPARHSSSPPARHSSSTPPALRNGHELWATVDVCRAAPSPMLGVRGSMPSDGQPHETMYMLFRVQYMDAKAKRWTDLPRNGESGLVKVGPASATRQAGRTFEMAAPAAGESFQLRGLVEFQWRRGSKVVLSTTRVTSAGHPSAAGAVPRGYSAATCTIR